LNEIKFKLFSRTERLPKGGTQRSEGFMEHGLLKIFTVAFIVLLNKIIGSKLFQKPMLINAHTNLGKGEPKMKQ